MKSTAETYEAPRLQTFGIIAEEGFALSAGGSIDDLPITDWSAPSPFQFDGDETF